MNIRKVFKVSLKVIVYMLISLALVSYLISTYKVKKGQEFLPTVFGLTGVTIKTGSMTPIAEVGDYVVLKKAKEEDIEVNDIITFVAEDILVTHRVDNIIKKGNEIQFITKGDANNTVDNTSVSFNEIVGKSVLVIPRFGSVLSWMTSTKGLLIVISIIIGLNLLPDKKEKPLPV